MFRFSILVWTAFLSSTAIPVFHLGMGCVIEQHNGFVVPLRNEFRSATHYFSSSIVEFTALLSITTDLEFH
jgi:hypothetical protein